ncbi:hypothetical protein AB0J55_13945 [Amycolatopsis sp. NPDC049688]|uniref:hypothetical protein n=1 Tax=Amycolatopsis sp. NPDC049688 TaxID=3154733 RepID=UPI00343E7870
MLLLAMTTLVATGVSAEAAPAPSQGSDVLAAIRTMPAKMQGNYRKIYDTQQEFGKSYTALPRAEATASVSAVKANLASGKLVIHLPAGAVFDQNNAKAYVNARNGATLLYLPIVGGGLVGPSSLTVGFDRDGGLADYAEQDFAVLSPASAHVSVWANGELKADATGYNDGTVQFSGQSATPPPQAQPNADVGKFFSVLNSCLSSAGIPQSVVTLITIGCGIACLGTVGAGCVVCIVAAAAAEGGIIGYCAGKAAKEAGF